MVVGEVERLEQEVRAFSACLDPDSVPLPEVDAVYRSLARTQKLVAGAMLRLARRVEDSGGWARRGERSPEEYLGKQAGTSAGQAKAALATSRTLPELDGAVDDAVRAGELSPQQAGLIADAASVSRGAEQELVAGARRQSLPELREACGRAKAAGDRDAEARRARVRASRHARHRETADGGGEIVYRSSLDETAEVWSVIQGHADAVFRRARAEGRREPPERYAADAVLELARTAAARGEAADGAPPVTPAKVIVRIDWDALVRGHPLDGEVCEISGIGPVPVSVVRSMIASGDPFLAAVVTKGSDVVTVAHQGRRPTAWQQTALLWRDPTCQALGCGMAWRLETDHRWAWADSKITLVGLVDRLCDHHHDLKTYQGWMLVDGTGTRPMVPPDDPRHPGRAGVTSARAGPDPPDPALFDVTG